MCEQLASVGQVRELFQGNDGGLMRACINVAVEWDNLIGPVLWHAAHTDGVGDDVVKLLHDEGGAEVDCRGEDNMTPLLAVAWRDDEEAGVEVARGEFVLWSWIHIVLTHTLFWV